VTFCYFGAKDVVRHELVMKIIGAYARFKEAREKRRQEAAEADGANS
jgi:phosphate starvation-inducible protein PhoH